MEEQVQPKQPLWTRAFILLTAIQTLDLFCYNMITPVIASHATGLGFSLVMAGIVAGAFAFAALFSRPISGFLSDRFGRRRIVLAAVVVGCLCQAGYAFATDFAALFALRVIHGFFYALFGTAISALAMDSLPDERRSEGMGWFGTSYVLANALGPALGVAVSDAFGFMPMFLLGAGISASTVLLGLALPRDKKSAKQAEQNDASQKTGASTDDESTAATSAQKKPEDAESTAGPSIKDAYHARHGVLATIDRFISIKSLPLAIAAGCYLTIWGIIATYVVMVGDARGVVGISAFFVVNSITLFFTRPFAGKIADKRGLAAVFVPSVAFEAAAILLIAFSGQLWLFLVAAACKALGSGTVTPSIQAECGKLEPPERSGVAMSTYLLGTDVGYALGPVIGGAVSAAFGFEAMFLAGLPILALGAGTFAAWHFRQRRRMSA